jgi:hypothetical protein
MADCEKLISKDIDINCENPIQRGLEANSVLINRNDIESITYDETNPNTVTAITLKTGMRGYKCYVPGQTPYTGIVSTLEIGTYVNKWNKDVPIVVLDNGPDVAANIIDPLANGEFVFISENRFKGDGSKAAFQIYGVEQGLKASAGNDGKYDEELEGGWSVTLTETAAPKSANFVYSETYAATKALVESLTTVA